MTAVISRLHARLVPYHSLGGHSTCSISHTSFPVLTITTGCGSGTSSLFPNTASIGQTVEMFVSTFRLSFSFYFIKNRHLKLAIAL